MAVWPFRRPLREVSIPYLPAMKMLWLCALLGYGTLLGAQDFYDADRLHEVRITLPVGDWDTILDGLKQRGNGERMLGSVVVDGVRYDSVGVRYKGNSSYHNVRKSGGTKLPFNIKLDYVRPEQGLPGGYNSIKLSNGFRDPGFIREVLAYELANRYMHAPHCALAKVYVNGEYFGLYSSTESIDKRFLKKHFANNDSTLVKCDPNWDATPRPGCKKSDKASLTYLGDSPPCYFPYYEMKSARGWRKLAALTKRLSDPKTDPATVVDVDQALWMLAYNNLIVNLDSYTGQLCHNYYLYENPDGTFTPLIWDLNLSFGGFRFLDSWKALDNEALQSLSPFVWYKRKDPRRPLISRLLSDPLYRKLYVGKMHTMAQAYFASGEYLDRARSLRRLIDAEVPRDPKKLYTQAQYAKSIDRTVSIGKVDIIGIEELMHNRLMYLEQHPVFGGVRPVVDAPTLRVVGDTAILTATLPGTEAAYVVYRKNKKKAWQRRALTATGTAGYTGTFPAGPGTAYYLIAEGQRMALTYPAEASTRPLRIEKPAEPTVGQVGTGAAAGE